MTNSPTLQTRHSKVLIIGSGPAGYRAALAPMLVDVPQLGGQLRPSASSPDIDGIDTALLA